MIKNKQGEVFIVAPKDETEKIVRSGVELSKIEESKKISVREASAYSLMDGFGLRYVSPYALAVGANNAQIGLLSSLPSLIGNLSQLFSLRAMKIWPRKKIVFLGVFLQAIMWLVLIAAGSLYFIFDLKGAATAHAVILIYTLLILFGAFSGPAWQSWMKDLVTKDNGKYFGRRSRIATLVSLVCMLLGGFILDYFKQTKIFVGFIILFSLAFIGRTISSRLILKQYEPKFKVDDKYYFSLKYFIKRMYKNNFGRFVMYFSLVCLATNISSPFNAVFMLKDLNFSYSYFMAVSTASVVTTFLFVSLWGKFADKYGNLKVMKITGALIPIVPLFWLIAPIFRTSSVIVIYLVIVEAFSGAIWSGFNLAVGNFMYDAVSRQRMAICSTYLNIISCFGVLIGAMFGGFISSLSFNFFGLSPIMFVLLLGAIARFIVYFSMNSKIREVRAVKYFSVRKHLKEVSKKLMTSISSNKFFEYVGVSSTQN